jgi:hypothetical protein
MKLDRFFLHPPNPTPPPQKKDVMMVVVVLVNHNLPLVDSKGDEKAHKKASFMEYVSPSKQ